MLAAYYPPMAGAPYWPGSQEVFWGGGADGWGAGAADGAEESQHAAGLDNLSWWAHCEGGAGGFPPKGGLDWLALAQMQDSLLPQTSEGEWNDASSLEDSSWEQPEPPPPAPLPAAPRAAVPAALLSPMRLPVGPEPADPPPLMELPPGLLPPPGFTLARAATLPARAEAAASPAAAPLPGGGLGGAQAVAAAEAEAGPAKITPAAAQPRSAQELAPGISVCRLAGAGGPCTRVEWHIEDLRGKLQASMGRPLVSPPFSVRGLRDLRLMVFPDARDAIKSARSRERRGMYAAMVRRGPLHGALRLKADSLEAGVGAFRLTVGDARRGPFAPDFAACVIHGCDDFGVDWLRQLDAAGGLRVGLELLDPEEDAAPAAAEAQGVQQDGQSPRSPSSGAESPVSPGLLDAGAPAGGRPRSRRAAAPKPRTQGC